MHEDKQNELGAAHAVLIESPLHSRQDGGKSGPNMRKKSANAVKHTHQVDI